MHSYLNKEKLIFTQHTEIFDSSSQSCDASEPEVAVDRGSTGTNVSKTRMRPRSQLTSKLSSRDLNLVVNNPGSAAIEAQEMSGTSCLRLARRNDGLINPRKLAQGRDQGGRHSLLAQSGLHSNLSGAVGNSPEDAALF